jgi:DNA polymerase III epsilon subunit-like protein
MHVLRVHTRAKRFVALEIKTTGDRPSDRIVTLGAIRLEDGEISRGLHLVFDPRKNSSSEAHQTHGWSDWETRFQDLFVDWAPRISEWLSWGDEIVAHNGARSMYYLQRELSQAGSEQLQRPVVSTVGLVSSKLRTASVNLDDCIARIGLDYSRTTHNALEDAALTASLYLTLTTQQSPLLAMVRTRRNWPAPTNARAVPPHPNEKLPRRRPKSRKM